MEEQKAHFDKRKVFGGQGGRRGRRKMKSERGASRAMSVEDDTGGDAREQAGLYAAVGSVVQVESPRGSSPFGGRSSDRFHLISREMEAMDIGMGSASKGRSCRFFVGN